MVVYGGEHLYQLFDDRGMMPLYEAIKRNKFRPFGITEGMEDAYERLSKKYNIPNPLSKRIKKQIDRIEKRLTKQRLNKDFIIDEERYLFDDQNIIEKGINLFKKEETKPLPEGFSQTMPQPVVNTTAMASKNPITNLTRTEDALLSPTEKVIAGRT